MIIYHDHMSYLSKSHLHAVVVKACIVICQNLVVSQKSIRPVAVVNVRNQSCPDIEMTSLVVLWLKT